jgi:hypothetical protein
MRRTLATGFWALPALFLFVIVLTAGRGGDVQGELHTVVITVSTETGDFSYSLDPVRATRGDRVQFISEQGNWSVNFGQNSPFNEKRFNGRRAGPRRLPIRGNTPDGSYKYFVAVAIGEDVYSDDPEIIVGPRGPGE